MMIFTDTHTHLYLEQFDEDRDAAVRRAIDRSVRYMLLPNIDRSSTDRMLDLCERHPRHCFPMMGLHPTSVDKNYRKELDHVSSMLETKRFYAVGEVGIDLYWDSTHIREQKDAFRLQIKLAKEKGLPVVIHTRNAFDEIFHIVEEEYAPGLRGVFHCFTGNTSQAEKISQLGFLVGIGGVLTFKNSGLDRVVKNISLEHILLETDSPFLAPAPYRGKRNESSYIPLIADKLAEIKGVDVATIAQVTTENAMALFKLEANEQHA